MEENNNTVEPIQQEEPKKKRKLRRGTIPKLFLALIMFVAGVTLIVISIKYDGNEVQKPEENNTTDLDIGPVVEPPENTTIYENVFIYTKEKTESGKQNYDILILRNDNTFVYNYDSAYSSTPIVGTYKEDGENISFEEKISYGTDDCFYTEGINFQKYTGVKGEDKITITTDGETKEFLNTIIPNGDQPTYITDSWYSINPADGVRPEGTNYGMEDDTWINCNNLEN